VLSDLGSLSLAEGCGEGVAPEDEARRPLGRDVGDFVGFPAETIDHRLKPRVELPLTGRRPLLEGPKVPEQHRLPEVPDVGHIDQHEEGPVTVGGPPQMTEEVGLSRPGGPPDHDTERG